VLLAIVVAAHGLALVPGLLRTRERELDNAAPFGELLWVLVVVDLALAGLTLGSAYVWRSGASRIPMVAWDLVTALLFGGFTALFGPSIGSEDTFFHPWLLLAPAASIVATLLVIAGVAYPRSAHAHQRA
jgi:hypothetical protein